MNTRGSCQWFFHTKTSDDSISREQRKGERRRMTTPEIDWQFDYKREKHAVKKCYSSRQCVKSAPHFERRTLTTVLLRYELLLYYIIYITINFLKRCSGSDLPIPVNTGLSKKLSISVHFFQSNQNNNFYVSTLSVDEEICFTQKNG